MGFIHGANRPEESQFPERLDDSITAENPVRFLDAFVDPLNLTTLGFQRATPAATGRPAYHPADLLKLYLYGYSAVSGRVVAWNRQPTGMWS